MRAISPGADFDRGYSLLRDLLVNNGVNVPTATWQAQDVTQTSTHSYTRELMNVTLELRLRNSKSGLQDQVGPNLPWAEDHFLERVSGQPLNPPPSEEWWPFRVQNNEAHKQEDQKFSHTYPERFWPRHANEGTVRPNGRQVFTPHNGIRYQYGDLADVVQLLRRDPYTRQAYLPVWFPEDTGAVDGQRVPCTLGYHFMIRPHPLEGHTPRLHIFYYIRSCDFLRHFRDDVYMAGRLAQWVASHTESVADTLTMHMASLHVFRGDQPLIGWKDD